MSRVFRRCGRAGRGLVALVLVAVACSSANEAAPAASAPVQARDALLWPFRSDSIWNTPIGDGASYVAAAITSSTGLDPDEDVLILTPTAPVVPVYEHTAGWDASTTRCANVTPKVLMSVPIPADFRTDPGYLGASPNAAAAVMLADGRTVRQMQPFHRCADGRAVASMCSTTTISWVARAWSAPMAAPACRASVAPFG